MDTSRSETNSLIENCLARIASGDHKAWDDLITYAFDRLLSQCKVIVKQELSRPNPLVTENSVLAATYVRLLKAMKNEKVCPTTSREFFGLTARNIRWQIQDMIRKPSHRQVEEGVIEQCSVGTNILSEVVEREKWYMFYEAVETLTVDEREIFDLIRINGLSQYEAAEVVGLSRNQLDNIWRRIKTKIAKYCQSDNNQHTIHD